MGARGRKSQASLTVVGTDDPAPRAAPSLEPPRPLGKQGRALWDRIVADYDLGSALGVEVLAQACAAIDTAERCKRDGDTRNELQARALAARLLARLEG